MLGRDATNATACILAGKCETPLLNSKSKRSTKLFAHTLKVYIPCQPPDNAKFLGGVAWRERLHESTKSISYLLGSIFEELCMRFLHMGTK